MIGRRLPSPLWYCLALLMGVLAVLSRPAAAVSRPAAAVGHEQMSGLRDSAHGSVAGDAAVDAAVEAEFDDVRTLLVAAHGVWCPRHVSAPVPQSPRSHSWHRGGGRRHQRGDDPLVASSVNPAGSIPASEPLNAQRGAWPTSVMLPLSVTGRLAAPPRGPPTLN